MMVVNLLTCVFEALLITMVLGAFSEDRPRFRGFGLLNVALISALIIVSNIAVSMTFLNLIIIGLAIALSAYMYTKSAIKSVGFAVALVLVFSMCEIVTLFIITLVAKIDAEQAVSNENYRLLGIVLSKMVTFVILKLVCYRRKRLMLEFKTPYWILFVSIFLTLTVTINLMFLLRYNSQAEIHNTMVVFCSLGLLYIAFLVMHIVERMSVFAEGIVEREKHNAELQEQIYIKGKEKNEADMLRRLRHDFKMHEIALKAYLDKGEIEEVKNHINKMSECMDSYMDSKGLD